MTYLSIMLPLFHGISLFIVFLHTTSAQTLPDSQAATINELEHLYLDDTGPGGFKSGIDPCSNYVDSTTGLPNNTLGRETAAQWIRTSFRKAPV